MPTRITNPIPSWLSWTWFKCQARSGLWLSLHRSIFLLVLKGLPEAQLKLSSLLLTEFCFFFLGFKDFKPVRCQHTLLLKITYLSLKNFEYEQKSVSCKIKSQIVQVVCQLKSSSRRQREQQLWQVTESSYYQLIRILVCWLASCKINNRRAAYQLSL